MALSENGDESATEKLKEVKKLKVFTLSIPSLDNKKWKFNDAPEFHNIIIL